MSRRKGYERRRQRRGMGTCADRAEGLRGRYIASLGGYALLGAEFFSESACVRGLDGVHEQDQYGTYPAQSHPSPCLRTVLHVQGD